MRRILPVLIAIIGVCTTGAAAQDYGIEFKTVGSPGNAPATATEFPLLGLLGIGPVGGVDYSFRMAKTELTVSQYFEFVQAYSPLNPGVALKPGFFGSYIHNTSGDPMNPKWVMDSAAANFSMNMSWEFAARYCNWITNGKANQAWAFETGAYEASTFKIGPSGEWEGQPVHTPGAKYWIASVDEWIKAMHYDPNKLGANQPGYWAYPAMSDTELIAGAPGTHGAQTAVGSFPGKELLWDVPVGSYPNAQSPWGLLDGSGCNGEWLEWTATAGDGRAIRGSETGDTDGYRDRLDTFRFGLYWGPSGGLRISSAIPAPSAIGLFLAYSVCLQRRSRK